MTISLVSRYVLGAVVTLSLVACSDKKDAEKAASVSAPAPSASSASAPAPTPAASGASAAAPPGPPVSVTTVKAELRDMAVVLKATGTVMPLTSVDVKAQASTLIKTVHIKEGQFVKAGDLMFTLDARSDEANVAKARAQLAKDQATLADAQRQFKRSQQLFSQNFISQGAVDTTQAVVEAATATVAADQAAIDAAHVALSYAQVRAPHSGRAGAISVSSGSAVQSNASTLVTITQLDPIAVGFSLPQRNLVDAIAALKDGGASVTATLADNGGSFKGKLKFVDNTVDAASGAVKAKAVFANKEERLWPGAFVEISQTVSTLKEAVIVPQAVIIQGARGTIVYVVEDGKAVMRPIKQLMGQNGEAAVTGLQAGETVVLDGKQNVRPGSVVVERAKDPKANAPAGAASGSRAP
ncbi:MAG: efflux RND transporter periplasmic adaptor subunit [Sulfuritalea sp.]|nr:efflux RND transporter periplasmic adaptor subunit [Sulfuritalea sp.]